MVVVSISICRNLRLSNIILTRGEGLEPPYPGPKPGGLPLADPQRKTMKKGPASTGRRALLGSPGCLLGVTPARCGPSVGSPVARQAGPDPDTGGSNRGSNESWLTDPPLASQTRSRRTRGVSTIIGRHLRRKSSPKIRNPSPAAPRPTNPQWVLANKGEWTLRFCPKGAVVRPALGNALGTGS